MEKIIIIYLFAFIVFFILSFSLKVKERNFLFVSQIILCFFTFMFYIYLIGFRPPTAGNDTPRYVSAFNDINDFHSAPEIGYLDFGNREPGFWYLAAFIKFFSSDPQSFLIFHAILVFILLAISYYFFLKRFNLQKFYCTAVSIVLLTYFVVYTGNTLRQILIIPLVYLALLFFYERKYTIAIFILGISTTIHISAIAVLPLFLILLNSYLGFALIIISLIFIVSLFQNPEILIQFIGQFSEIQTFLIEKIRIYTQNKFALENYQYIFQVKNFWFLFFFFLVFLIGYYLLRQVKFKEKNFSNILLKISLYFFLILIVFYNYPQIGDRIFPFLFYLIPLYVISLRKSIVLLLYLMVLFINLIVLFITPSVRYTLGF